MLRLESNSAFATIYIASMFFNTFMIDCCKFCMEKLLLKANNTGLHKVTKS
jgi:hypothetical protein